MLSKRIATVVSLVVGVLVGAGRGRCPGARRNPSLPRTARWQLQTRYVHQPERIAVEESTGDVYVADIGTGTVSKFDATGGPVDFSSLGSNALTGSATPAGSFSFPDVYGTPAAIAVDNSKNPSDPSAGDCT